MTRSAAAPLAAALLLGACSKHAGQPAASDAPSVGAIEPHVAQIDSIPSGMWGRWGLVPADCEPGRVDAKGLMQVDRVSLGFYESRGLIGAVTVGDATHLRAMFAMTGEGMQWNREQSLVLDPANDTLVRQEFGKDAIPQPLTYHRCPDNIKPTTARGPTAQR